MEFTYPWRFSSRRSTVMGTGGMVSTSQPLAARAGVRTLEAGGTAADAAITTAAVLAVVEPHMTGIGGDMFALAHFAGQTEALNGSGGTPAEATIPAYENTDLCVDDGQASIPFAGGLAVTVPGALGAWKALLDRYGAFSLEDALQPAINYARRGFPVTERVATEWENATDRVRAFDEATDTFLVDGNAPLPGQRFRNPTFAETLESIATDGIERLYAGDIGESIVETVQAHGGFLTTDDLREYQCEWTDPISTEYRGIELLEHPPNGQGIIALEALNIVEKFDLSADPTDLDRLHILIEAIKAAFADGYATVSDPAVVDIPVDSLLSADHAARRAREIETRAQTYDAGIEPRGHDTVYLSVVDGDGNAVSLINSLYQGFGSGLTTRGFALQNRGSSFTLDPDHANSLQPGKRPFHTIIPAMLKEDGTFRAAWGVMGGSMQPQGHMQVLCNLVDSSLNPQAAIDAPRFRWITGRRVAIESSRIPDATIRELRDRGHEIVTEAAFYRDGSHFGGAQCVYRDETGVLIGGSDPRKDGQAIGY